MHAGCDLSMPGGSTYMEDRVAEAVRSGALAETDVDACAARVIALALKGENRPKGRAFDQGRPQRTGAENRRKRCGAA